MQELPAGEHPHAGHVDSAVLLYSSGLLYIVHVSDAGRASCAESELQPCEAATRVRSRRLYLVAWQSEGVAGR